MSVKIIGKLAAAFVGYIADATQIGRSTANNSVSLDTALNAIENSNRPIPQVLQDIADASTIAHEAGDIIYDPGFDRAVEVKITDRTSRTASFVGDSEGISIDNIGDIIGWQTVVGDFRNTFIGAHIAEFNTPSPGSGGDVVTRSLLKWRSGSNSYTLLGITSDGHLFVNDPTTTVDSAVPDSSLADGNILSDLNGAVVFQADDHVSLDIIVSGSGSIRFIPTYTRNNVTTQLNEIIFTSAGDFNLNQIHLQHNITATAFDRIILAHTTGYINRDTFTTDLSSNVDSDVYNIRRTGEGQAFIEVDTPISFPQFETSPSVYGFTVHGIDFTTSDENAIDVTIATDSSSTFISTNNNQFTLFVRNFQDVTRQTIIDFINNNADEDFPYTVALSPGFDSSGVISNDDLKNTGIQSPALISGGGGRLLNTDEQDLLTTLDGFESADNDGKILGIESGAYAVIDAPSGGGGLITPYTGATTYFHVINGGDAPDTLNNAQTNSLINIPYQELQIPSDIPTNANLYLTEPRQAVQISAIYVGTNEIYSRTTMPIAESTITNPSHANSYPDAENPYRLYRLTNSDFQAYKGQTMMLVRGGR